MPPYLFDLVGVGCQTVVNTDRHSHYSPQLQCTLSHGIADNSYTDSIKEYRSGRHLYQSSTVLLTYLALLLRLYLYALP